jgi:hypothetical protein
MKSATVLLIFGLAMPALAQSSAKSLSDTCQKAFSATVTNGLSQSNVGRKAP